jgi:hypothetical protein
MGRAGRAHVIASCDIATEAQKLGRLVDGARG